MSGSKGSKVARLALVAANAVRDGDLHRAIEVLEEIHATATGGAPDGSRQDLVQGRSTRPDSPGTRS